MSPSAPCTPTYTPHVTHSCSVRVDDEKVAPTRVPLLRPHRLGTFDRSHPSSPSTWRVVPVRRATCHKRCMTWMNSTTVLGDSSIQTRTRTTGGGRAELALGVARRHDNARTRDDILAHICIASACTLRTRRQLVPERMTRRKSRKKRCKKHWSAFGARETSSRIPTQAVGSTSAINMFGCTHLLMPPCSSCISAVW
jgi:hypothetical protein